MACGVGFGGAVIKMTSIITNENLCTVNEKVLSAAAMYAKGKIVPIFVIVPDRFTLTAEKLLLGTNPNLLNVRAVTFSMLYHTLAPADHKPLDKTRAVLFMWRAIRDVEAELIYFRRVAHQYAFAEKMFNTINQLQSSMADFAKLESNARAGVTRDKMHDISVIQRRYAELTAEFTDGSGMLGWLIDNVATSPVIRGAHVYLTGFEHLSLQRTEVIRRIAAAAKSFTMGIRRGSELQEVLPL